MASSPSSNNKALASDSPPIPSRPNPKPRNSEIGDLMRRSFQANPFPADSSRRNSIGREINIVEYGDKENQNNKDQISNVLKTPKGAKNFMSPTISAASKINPSPRKKILSDKNQMSRSFDKSHHHQVRSFVSFSDVVSIIGEDKDHEQISIHEQKQLDVVDSHDMTVTDFEEIHRNKSSGDLDDSSFKISSLPPSVPYTFPVLGSHEVDPLMEPYDPKKNYLSPRPQFLHYKPNPRVEHHSDECKQLEELFISESSSSDTDLSAEESQHQEEVDLQEGVEEDAEVIEDEDDEAVECDEEEEELVAVENTEEETHQISKQSYFKTSKLLGWILTLGVAYLVLVSSITFTQPHISQDSPIYKFHISPEITQSARESFEQLSEKLGMLAGSSIVYMNKLISSLREEKGNGPFRFHNLTDLLEDTRSFDTVFQTTIGVISVDSQDWNLNLDIEEENVGHHEPEEPDNSDEISLEALSEKDGNEFEQNEIKRTTDTEMNGGGEEYSDSLSEESSSAQEADGVEEHNLEESHESETSSAQNDEENMEEGESHAHQIDDMESATISGHQQEETREVVIPETSPAEEGIEEIAGNSFDISAETSDVDGNDLEEDIGIGEVVNAAGWEEEDSGILLSNQKKMLALILTVMVLIASLAAAFLLAKKKAKPVMKKLHEDGEPTTISSTKEVKSEHVAAAENPITVTEKLSSLNIQEKEEVDHDDDRKSKISVSPFPSEMSFSFRKNRSMHGCNNNNRNDLKEYDQSGGGGGKKSNDSCESMASSASEYSIGSVSYGSFTTYEKIQKKRSCEEEEMVTPVRRSSRIRNNHQQHSGK